MRGGLFNEKKNQFSHKVLRLWFRPFQTMIWHNSYELASQVWWTKICWMLQSYYITDLWVGQGAKQLNVRYNFAASLFCHCWYLPTFTVHVLPSLFRFMHLKSNGTLCIMQDGIGSSSWGGADMTTESWNDRQIFVIFFQWPSIVL